MEPRPISGNPAVERAAIEFVIEQERLQGRKARDTRGRGAGDIESDGRIIEVKASGGWWRTGLLYFTPPQLREGERNADYYVYIVENVAQGDPAKFTLRVLHGEDLQRLFAEAKPHRSYVALRAADQARLTRLGAKLPDAGDDQGGRGPSRASADNQGPQGLSAKPLLATQSTNPTASLGCPMSTTRSPSFLRRLLKRLRESARTSSWAATSAGKCPDVAEIGSNGMTEGPDPYRSGSTTARAKHELGNCSRGL